MRCKSLLTRMQWRRCPYLLIIGTLTFSVMASAHSSEIKLDERPADPGEWGYRPGDGEATAVTPPGFSWRPQKGVTGWEMEVTRDGKPIYQAKDIGYNVHCPSKKLDPGTYTWRYRGTGKDMTTTWSKTRSFTIARDASVLVMPARADLLTRIPEKHPRLFIRPEDLPQLKERARGDLKKRYDELVAQCEKLLKRPPPTKEPLKYDRDMKRGSDPWRKRWWGNRSYTIRTLNSAATLAFTHLLGGRKEYADLAKRILLDCAKWDPKGATGYRYNDEAGMPYNYYFSRTYTFVYDQLTEKEREACRRVMKVRGDEMYGHLCPRHLWKPYSSHSNRAWHFLGEVGIAFLGEVEGADEWAWFAANVFFNCYPVWCDDDGGWHEGANYWNSYQGRFTWWADVMRSAMKINAYDKPYYSKVGYYAMYLLPPNKVGGGFGDLNARVTASRTRELLSTYAAQSGNAHWAWYVDRLGGPKLGGGYIGFVRGALPAVKAKPPADLPTSRLFAGTGQAMLNTNLDDANEGVQIVFKSSPFGTQSHGYEANNSFLLWAYGDRLLIRTGLRDSYGSEHHKGWMWSTRSTNCITLNGGEGQGRRSQRAKGRIVAFKTTPGIDIVAGEAAEAYLGVDGKGKRRRLERFTRTVIFVKPELMVVYDRLAAVEPVTFDYWLHALKKIETPNQHELGVTGKNADCAIDLLHPEGLELKQTDQYDPNPRSRVKLREWHLTCSTLAKSNQVEFIAVYRPHRKNVALPKRAELKKLDGGYALRAPLSQGEAVLLLPLGNAAQLSAWGLTSEGEVVVERRGAGEKKVLRVP